MLERRDIDNIHVAIEKMLMNDRNRKIVICPFGQWGMKVKEILNNGFGIRESVIVDNYYCKFNEQIKSVDWLKKINLEEYTMLFTLCNDKTQLYDEVVQIMGGERHIFCCINQMSSGGTLDKKWGTLCGKYSYGPLCDHRYVESVGSFTSIAYGCCVVGNHAVDMLSTHDFLTAGCDDPAGEQNYERFKGKPWYFEGITPHGKPTKRKKVKIGNDVWLGRNVLITNGADIGNGVIAGAGAVITKDVPDYAIVAGVPARIIRYRYSKRQIEALNQIQWWNWPDEKIRDNYEDFYLDVDEFIKKYAKREVQKVI